MAKAWTWFLHLHGEQNKRNKVMMMVSFLSLFAIVLFWKSGGQQKRHNYANPFEDLYNNKDSKGKCQETVYQPFLVGCPSTCDDFRTDLPPSVLNIEPMYRLTIEWYFGQPKLELHPPPQPITGTYYEMGYNYQSCSLDFVNVFGRASDYLEKELLKQQSLYYPDMNIKTQARMHMSLGYLCCLRLEEAYHVQEIMEEFLHDKATFFHVTDVTFERVECWKERFNSITHIVVVDNASQVRLLALLNQLEQKIQAAKIPLTISRLTQMPFHATLLGVQLGDKYSTDPIHIIDPVLSVSYETIQTINRELWPKDGVTFDIAHRPKYSRRPILQKAVDGVE
jgi:hypothetical protein